LSSDILPVFTKMKMLLTKHVSKYVFIIRIPLYLYIHRYIKKEGLFLRTVQISQTIQDKETPLNFFLFESEHTV